MKIARLFVFGVLWCVATFACAQSGARGAPFFLLSDASYGPDETAMVRLEAQSMGAVAEYGGADVYVYRVQHPLEFLKRQKNLHRIDVAGDYEGPGLSNALARMWDNWWVESRTAWRTLFSRPARQAVTAQAPETHTHPLVRESAPEALNPQYRPLKGHTLVDRFRYPVQFAQPIQPPAGVKLAGSSSEFIAVQEGNVMIPIGRRAPGLYLVEAMVGEHRAVTMVFVSSSIAVTKVSSRQMLVWVAERHDGKPMRGAATVWTDGVGVLASGRTDASGLAIFARSAPEKTYVFGEDAKGGVFIAENYYYDSEIYNTKLYAVTDRPLYRPGETVYVKFLGRAFRSARESTAIAAGELKLQVFDANGFPVAGQTLSIDGRSGADTSFQLPDNAVAGGYELRFSYQGDAYGAAFRVAEFQKPHFEINVLPSKRDFKTGEAVTGRLQLVYPDGKPVPNAKVELGLRAQRLTMIEGDLGYAGQFPMQLTNTSLTTDAQGNAGFTLPAATEPSRYVLTVLATDGAAYRVRVTRELLIERGAGTYALKSERAFSAAGESVRFGIRTLAGGATPAPPAAWEWVRLENRRRESGALANVEAFSVTFDTPGTYTVSLRDAQGNIVGAASHYVSGEGVGAPQGSIEMVFDRNSYRPGDTAGALITFPQPVQQALFTLERDSVEKTALMTRGTAWVRAQRISDRQWRAELPVQDTYGPNITFSVAYVKDGEYVFQNLGLKVEQPRIEVAVQADKAQYLPGEIVTLDLAAHVGEKPAAGALLTVSVVDEMIYVLQPEIAPDVFDFFYHPRRNNVRTSASLNFIGYDLARPPSKPAVPSRRQTHERAIKLLERPRREDKDTAYWQPSVAVDEQGHAKVTFVMPDSLTRWRVTVRAADPAGLVGQSVAHVLSDKNFYVKWTSPTWMRAQDAPRASVAIFNQGAGAATLELSANGAGVQHRASLRVKPGANFVALPLKPGVADTQIELALLADGRKVDALQVPLRILPQHNLSPRSFTVPVTQTETALKLPADATNLRLQFADGANAQFRRVMDDLIAYPYGCVEQTASRLIPYSLALQSLLPGDERLLSQLTQRLHAHRFRLAQMAGPQATFGWWSMPDKDADPLLTTYAYYADWYASRALRLELPADHWDRLLEVYRKQGVQRSPWHRALMLAWMQEMELPVRSLAEALAEEAFAADAPVRAASASQQVSTVFAEEGTDVAFAMTRLLAAYVVQQAHGTLPQTASAGLEASAARLGKAGLPVGEALLVLTGRMPTSAAAGVLEKVRGEDATIDRALALVWIHRALRGTPALTSALAKVALDGPWQDVETATGLHLYRWPNAAPPAALRLAKAPPAGLVAVAQFDSRDAEQSTLPVRVRRQLYRLVREPDQPPEKKPDAPAPRGQAAPDVTSVPSTYTLVPLLPEEALTTDQLYLDELTLTPANGARLRYGIVEVPLPPGATADRTTWGVALRRAGAEKAEALERARYEQTPAGYAVPIDLLAGETVVRHLVRVAEAGTFTLPPARYYRMYQPEQKAYEEAHRAQLEIR